MILVVGVGFALVIISGILFACKIRQMGACHLQVNCYCWHGGRKFAVVYI